MYYKSIVGSITIWSSDLAVKRTTEMRKNDSSYHGVSFGAICAFPRAHPVNHFYRSTFNQVYFHLFSVPSGTAPSILYKVSVGENFVTTQFSHILFCREIHSELCYTYIYKGQRRPNENYYPAIFDAIPGKLAPFQFPVFNVIFRSYRKFQNKIQIVAHSPLAFTVIYIITV